MPDALRRFSTIHKSRCSAPALRGAGVNYNGQRALSWQTLWLGPFLLAGQLGSPGDVSRALALRLCGA